MSPADRTPPPSKRSLRRYGRLTGIAVPAALVATAISAFAAAPAQATEAPAPAASTANSYPWPPGPDGYPDPYFDPGPGLGIGPGLGLGPLIGDGPLVGDGPFLGPGPFRGPGPGPGPFRGPGPGPGPGRLAGCDIDSTSSTTVPNREFSVAVVRGRTYVGQRDPAQVSGVYQWQNLSGNAGYPGTGVCGASLSVLDMTQLSVKIVTFRGQVLENRCVITSTPPSLMCGGVWTPLLGQQPPPTL
ncbi:hypothetical protein [Streptomyces sp. NPDC026673]|uniref:hypothetical protein n=1 Tax=Streptomyces sp. NPDC026673 TaxID=3155724 RepID=UPI0033FF9E62